MSIKGLNLFKTACYLDLNALLKLGRYIHTQHRANKSFWGKKTVTDIYFNILLKDKTNNRLKLYIGLANYQFPMFTVQNIS